MENIDKKDIKRRLKKYVYAMEYYRTEKSGQQLLMESQRYFEDHFNAEEREYVKAHCPILIRIKLSMIGANIF